MKNTVNFMQRSQALVLSFAGLLFQATAWAQVPPSAAEVARYSGLHAAAQRGDVAQIQRLATAATVNMRQP